MCGGRERKVPRRIILVVVRCNRIFEKDAF